MWSTEATPSHSLDFTHLTLFICNLQAGRLFTLQIVFMLSIHIFILYHPMHIASLKICDNFCFYLFWYLIPSLFGIIISFNQATPSKLSWFSNLNRFFWPKILPIAWFFPSFIEFIPKSHMEWEILILGKFLHLIITQEKEKHKFVIVFNTLWFVAMLLYLKVFTLLWTFNIFNFMILVSSQFF